MQGGKDGESQAPPHVLIVGAGCTGALLAAMIPREAARRGRARPRVSVWEWGRGPAGRMTSFWADLQGQRVIADVGAQVISLKDPKRLPESGLLFKELNLNHYIGATLLFTIYTHSGNLI